MVTFIARLAGWALLLALAWWACAEGRPGSWGVGAPAVVLAAAIAAATTPRARHRLRPGAALRFAAHFAKESVKGGLDVARRALSPSLPLDAGLVELRTSLPEGAPRLVLADVVSLLPGSATVELDGDRLLVHALDTGAALERDLRELEARVAGLFDVRRGDP